MNLYRSLLFVLLLATFESCIASSFPSWAEKEIMWRHGSALAPKVGNGVTRYVYLYPTDRPIRTDYREAMEWSALTLKDWYTDQLDGEYTFKLPIPIVQSVALDHPASFYGSNNPGGSEYLIFWNNVLNEAFPKTGATFNDPSNVWIFFVDAGAGCNQLSGGGTSGIVVLSHNDLRGLIGDEFLDCNGVEYPPWTFTPQRWIGGQGHELGHAYGLPHPPGCDDGLPKCDYDALMWTGFYNGFPNSTYLREDEKPILIAGTYFQSIDSDVIFRNGFE